MSALDRIIGRPGAERASFWRGFRRGLRGCNMSKPMLLALVSWIFATVSMIAMAANWWTVLVAIGYAFCSFAVGYLLRGSVRRVESSITGGGS